MNFAKYLNELPVIPDIAQKILEMAQQGMDISFLELEQTISLDPGLTSKVLEGRQFCPLCQTEPDFQPEVCHHPLGLQ
jgi:hypothetical protein